MTRDNEVTKIFYRQNLFQDWSQTGETVLIGRDGKWIFLIHVFMFWCRGKVNEWMFRSWENFDSFLVMKLQLEIIFLTMFYAGKNLFIKYKHRSRRFGKMGGHDLFF
jgi:hypothetical protein